MNSPETPQVGERVLILLPEYVAGKVGVIIAEEILNHGEKSGNWIIEVATEELMVSLSTNEFQRLEENK